MKKLYYNYINIKALMLVMLMSVFALGAYAQTIDGFNTVPPDVQYYFNDDTDATVELQTSGTFPDGTIFYLHTGNSGIDFTEEDVLASVNDPGDAINFVWSTVGINVNHYVSAATGDFDSETIEIGTTASIAAGALAGSTYDMNGVGERKITTQAYDLSSSEEIILFVSLDASSVSDDRPLRVQFSTNGTDWNNMTDADASENEWSVGSPDNTPDLRFVLTSGQKSATTQFRVIQEGKDDYTVGEEPWTLDGTSFDIEIGGLNVVDNALVGSYDIAYPSTTITFFKDDNENSPVTYYAGMDVEVEGVFNGATDQVDDYEYTAVFENGGTRFLLEDAAGVNNNNDLSVTGTIPADIDYGLTWSVTIRAFNGATPTLGVDEDLLANIDTEGYNNGDSEFDADGDRFAISEPVDIQSTTNAQIDLQLTKTSAGLSPAGTEIVLEYTTDGSEFTQIGDPVSLNADLTEPLEFDLSSESGIVSSGTQFRVRQLSNNGLDLDTWDILVFDLFAGGNILFDQQEVDYFASNKKIEAPVIALDPVSVPDELIFPGDEVTLVYNVTDGSFPDGTELTAVFDGGDFNYNVGTSSLIVPGDDEDHEITITIPPVVESLTMYEVSLVSTTGAESNSRVIPVYNTNITIIDVASDNGVFDGTVDVIYPGDQITVNYNLDGSVGVGGELFLEVLDYGDPDTGDDDEFVVLNSATGAAIDGDISGDLPTNINYDDPGPAKVRLRVGNGLLADMSVVFAKYDDMGTPTDINSVSVGDAGVDAELLFDVESFVGNDPGDIDNFIGSGERSFNTLPYEMPFGGRITIVLNEVNASFDAPQTVLLQASNDGGQSFTTIAEEEYEGTNVTFDGAVDLPEALWGEEVIFKVIYNEGGESGEFVNELDIATLTVEFNDFGTANSEEFDISGQFRRPTITLEVLDDTDYIVGETVEVEYTTEGVFPGNTEFALLFTGSLNALNGGPLNPDGTDPDGDYDDGDDFEVVVATSADEGLGTFTFTVPDMAFEEDGTNDNLDLFDNLEVIAYNATGGADYMPNEDIDVDEDEQFLVIEGTDDEDGAYTFDKEGDRSLLTQAFDLSSADEVILSFTFSDGGIQVTDNQLTIPVLQVSTDAGETFQNIAVDEESLIGDGYLFNDNTYEVSVPAEFITDATHFRWYQALNLGLNQDVWSVSGITITLVNGNEISTFYTVGNDMQALTVSHPPIADYELNQVDADDAVFNGETVDLTLDKVYETTPDFPPAAQFTYLLYEPTMGEYVIDPDTDEPLVIGTSDDIGAFTATIPFYVVNDTYEIHVVISKDTEEGPYYYVGDSEGGLNIGTLDVFLRVIRTTFDFDENDVFYAGNTATFTLTLENDETNLDGVDGLFANLLVKDFDGGDLILATQEGLDDITVDLPPYLRGGDFEFVVEISQDAPLGNVGDIIGDSDLSNIEEDFDENFTAPDEAGYIVWESRDYFDSEFSDNQITLYYYFTVENEGNQNFYLEYSLNGDPYVTAINYGTGDYDNAFGGLNLPTEVENGGNNDFIRFRFRFSGDEFDGSAFTINNPFFTVISGTVPEIVEDDITTDNILRFENDNGRGLITTRAFEAGELDNVTLISFNLVFDEIPENMVDNQFLVLEYSIDGGESFSEISSLPDADAEETIDDENFLFSVNDEMRDNDVIFRFRQEERAGINVAINSFSFLFGGVLPFDYVSDNQVITNQTVLVTGISVEEGCQEDEITIDYEVRGRMGADNLVNVFYRSLDGSASGTLETEFNVTEGTGSAPISLIGENLFTTYDNNKFFRFRFDYDDETFEDYLYDGNGVISEGFVEIVAPIYEDAEWSTSGDVLACDSEDVTVFIDDPQNYFMYEVFNTETDAVLGTLVYDPEEGETEIDLGQITELTNLGLRITAMSSTGTSNCETFISADENEIEVLQDFELYSNLGGASSFRMVEAGQSVTVCTDQEIEILQVRRVFEDGSFTTSGYDLIEWFRDDTSNPVSVGGSFESDDIRRSGSYFARITTGSCVYTTESIQITVVDEPDQPIIAVASGNLEDCEGADPVVLEAPAGFTYYEWFRNGSFYATTQTIEVEETGNFEVRVSNVPFVNGCSSDFSPLVEVDRFNLPEFDLTTNNNINTGRIADGDALESCDEFTVYFHEDQSTNQANSGTVQIQLDGAPYASTESSNFDLTESGTYTFTWVNEELNLTCNVTSISFDLTIVDAVEEVPALTTADALDICEGEFVTLTAPAGFAYYNWYRDGSLISSNQDGFDATNNTLVVYLGGNYTVEVGNAANCMSPASNAIEVNYRSEPSGWGSSSEFFQSEASCGEGGVTFELTDTEEDYIYQLIEENTGNPSGAAVQGSNGPSIFLVSDPIAEPTDFYVQISYADGSGCVNDYDIFVRTGINNNVLLELEGNSIEAEFSNWDGIEEIRWFRNGVELRNRRGSSSITITDAAEYNIEVEFSNGCIVTSNTVATENQAFVQTYFGKQSVNTYPNPSTDVVNVSLNGGPLGEYEISIMSMSGQVVISKEVNKTEEEHIEPIDIQSLEKGIYNLRIQRGNKVDNFRIVKQ